MKKKSTMSQGMSVASGSGEARETNANLEPAKKITWLMADFSLLTYRAVTQ